MLDKARRALALSPHLNPVAQIVRSFASVLYITKCRGGFLPYVGAATLLAVAGMVPSEYGPLFMVAGDINGPVGDSIGFIGNILDPEHIAESAVRSSFCYTVFWIPFVAIMGVCAVGEGIKGLQSQLSVAHGVSGGSSTLARALVNVICIPPFYLLSCLPGFLAKMFLYDAPISMNSIHLFLIYLIVNSFILCALFAMSSLVAIMLRPAVASTLLSILPHLGAMLSYPSNYAMGNASPLWWTSPATWLMHSCSLNLSQPATLLALIYSLAVLAISFALIYVVCCHQEAHR